MHMIVTGCGGFIGSTLTGALLARGDTVAGVDSFTPYYDPGAKRRNLALFADDPGFTLVEADLAAAPLQPELLEAADVVFHQAGQPGVRASWREGFESYTHHNVLATQRLLDSVTSANPAARVVYASSSSIYGDASTFPVTEAMLPAPHSPYGVTKLAGEHLCRLYSRNFGLSTVALRYFTVYGPRQRPDMAIHRLIEAALSGSAFPLYGDGSQLRDFTYVDDIVAANLAAATAEVEPGLVANLSGGSSVSVRELIDQIEAEVDQPIALDRRDRQPGDPQRTGGSTEVAREVLGWKPEVDLAEGLRAQLAWHLSQRRTR
jgi:nucleoside-diphosphate-sugar epimerase